jgi:hypothetical protein
MSQRMMQYRISDLPEAVGLIRVRRRLRSASKISIDLVVVHLDEAVASLLALGDATTA